MCNFDIPFNGSSDELIAKASKAIRDAGGTFTIISVTQGNFSLPTPVGRIDGSYTIAGQVLSITITHKPGLVSCGRIEKELRERIGGG